MTARSTTTPLPCPALDDAPLTSVDAARAHVEQSALRDGPLARIGLELEAHLVDLHEPALRPSGPRVSALLDSLPALPSGSAITEEPGGQIELSTPPLPGVAAAVAGLRADREALRVALRERGFGAACLGADPARPLTVVNTAARYAAMQRHWATVGCSAAGRGMMAGTAALQVNLDAGPRAGWRDRVEHLHRIGPTLIAVSACSPVLAREASGWRSMRQQMWTGIDAARSGRVPAGDPTAAWAEYALAAPVMLVRDHETGGAEPVPSRVSFASWVSGDAKLFRRPTLRDLDYHLSTLYPPVRPRGYLEVRYLDSVPDAWWPGLAAITAALADDTDTVAEACEPVADAWVTAARDGLADPSLHRAALTCLRLALERAPDELRADVARYAELVEAGRSPGDLICDRIAADGPVAVLKEEAA